MVSEAPSDHETPAAPARDREHRRPHRGGLRRLIASVTRLVDLQYRIWLTQAKLAMMRMALYAGLFVGAIVFGILAVIFLCMAAFHVLTDVLLLPTWAALLIFGAGLALVAFILILIGTKMLTRTEAKDDQEGSK